VDSLANCCAGGQLSFRTDSPRIAVEAEFAHGHTMDHMPPTGQIGFDCYTGECGNMLYASTLRFDAKCKAYKVPLLGNLNHEMRQFTINFPLRNEKLLTLKIGIAPEAELLAPYSYKSEKKIVVYGTSITQGGCASRPGMCYTNILSRKIDAEFVNLGFSGNGKGEPEVMKTIASIPDMGLFIMDYEANIGNDIYENLAPSIDIIRSAYPVLPIVLISRIAYGQENLMPENAANALKRRDFQRDFVEKRNRAGDNNIFFIDGSEFFDGDPGEYAVDGCHATDYGFAVMAGKIYPTIRELFTI
jgi:hypothetical protein